MPRIRLLGNAVLSFMSKASSGYWHVFDPTNGYTAISATALRLLPLDKIADRYFFESDVLFRLGTVRAVVKDIPMVAVYQDEPSSLSVRRRRSARSCSATSAPSSSGSSTTTTCAASPWRASSCSWRCR